MKPGICTFTETSLDPSSGCQLGAGARIRDLLEEIELADQVGLDVFGVGEHHRPDYAVSAPAIVLAAGAALTQNIRLTSAVSVLSSDDPVRVFQDFALLDLISGGRAEIMAGRESFTESCPLFGQDLADYPELFSEKLDLLLRLQEDERVTWQGKHRASIDNRWVYPRLIQDPMTVWITTGGTPNSVVRAGQLGLPMALGYHRRSSGTIQSSGRAVQGGGRGGWPPSVSAGREHQLPRLPSGHPRGGRRGRVPALLRGHDPHWHGARGWSPYTRERFDAERELRRALFIGSPDEIVEKVLVQYELFRHQRFLLQVTVGPMTHAAVMRAIELFGTQVAPVIQKEIEESTPAASSTGGRA